MNKLFLLLSGLFLLIGCASDTKDKKKERQGAMAQSVGRINELSVVIETEAWKGALGDTIRKYFGAEVPGLPQEEPLFSMRQIPPSAFSGIARKNRTFLKVENASVTKVDYISNKFATPQLGVVITGKNLAEQSAIIREQIEQISEKLKAVETKEKQRRIAKSLEKLPQLESKFGLSLKVPSAYRIAREDDDFLWLRKDIPNGDMNLIIYEIPIDNTLSDTNTIADIIKIRDSVGSLKIPTDTGSFVTEEAYAPYLYHKEVAKRPTFVTKGTWEIKNRFLAGPFVNYMIKDTDKNRYVVLEGFILAPSSLKRDNMFELEAIIKSLRLL
ncbi:DUF4837 family protein [Aquimarina sp. ERC-38]|uniref:DUF4837 family protein n=1 Tax=Aquimarina sp. ERC-38 TaxID=2949996 RepID=UPI002244FEBB|nr:DUF4837 family protein [Aquimarina sp. ERC-38]UZO81852.1 DUF4837 family protein [Aquimarina sp. ERC-38]